MNRNIGEKDLDISTHDRAIKEWTQAELAARVDVTRKTINTIENRKFIPSAYLALKIARAFGVPVEEVFQIDDDLPAADHEDRG